MVALNEMDMTIELFKDHRSFGRVPEHIAKDVNVIARRDNAVPALDKLRVHRGQVKKRTVIEADNVTVRKMKVSSKEIHREITSDMVR